ncbi:MAG: T9SS type A sorting domain-containing protein [Flavobacteriia bacterium]|nr:T9SS type A sorting domain-containing protein [Flavobacteriia bacterium]OIP47400.1 MAG: hypothetical protein AUK46_05290 [Flavobacteriaceae bacterium CG2_30_31_66]PIV96691.1 MAG: hypothetical protein COW43_06750 [Flavobacteriaceae bacterium CG17_big_fil_post_rev_8_21_14_2_50_31_13]PIX11893.1 MAG: hypothetical protein COZ74_12815 [Flavobacteriaceae bacterium CG_4_8_14_3_um_filter_31_8]PIY16247.1 MAG: hypothetical protein COZ16_00690 [Flavobacteriaceae bacterium CG_4_10_14_3_um_filter_31_253]
MYFSRKQLVVVLVILSSCLHSQTRIKTLFYNTLNYKIDIVSQEKTPHLKTILETIQPDLFMVCELKNEPASNYLFENAILPFNANFKKAPYRIVQSPAKDLSQMVYYNSEKLTLEKDKVIATNVRDINHYTFKINTENSETNPLRIEVFVTHLKASTGYENRQQRLESVEDFVKELDRLPENSAILFAGDFNFYTSNEPGFQKIIDPTNSIKIIDPINRLCPPFPENGIDYFNEDNYNNTYFWNNSSFAAIHSQSTRSLQLNGDGAGGGMDDRFDFIMMSENLKTNSTVYFVENSYKTIGNNKNCYNSSVNDLDCTGEYSQNLRDALYYFSDHLPISMEIETPQNTLTISENNIPIKFIGSNLVSDYLSLHLTEEIKVISIYNLLGQKVYELKNNNNSEIKIATSSFNKGLYYLKTEHTKPLKFIKI